MSSTSENNKRIAKNTLFLYIRMLLIMAVSLYTSRVVLEKLGITDFGIYNVVGGIVAMLGFLSSSMSNAVQRFLSFEIGKGNEDSVRNIFSTAVMVHSAIAVLVFAVMEIAGVWYLNSYMNIPPDRLEAAHWVLQCTIVTTLFSIMQVPYNAIIIAKEQMGIYAYISILEVTLKLVIVYLLSMVAFDRLKLYSILVMVVSIGIMMVYRIYCKRQYKEARFRLVKDWKSLRELTSFAGWNMMGEISWAFCGQGVNIILNLFFGPTVNAARGIAEQVNAAVTRFVSNFQMAVNPQLVKTYATNQLDEMKMLLFRSTRFSYYLLYLISLPLILNMDFILRLWLVEVPEYAISFCRLVLICSLVMTVSALLAQVAKAYGQIRNYQMGVSFFIFLNFPFSYTVLKMGASPEATMLVNIAIQALLLFVRLHLVKEMIHLPVWVFLKEAVMPLVKVTCCSIIVPFLLIQFVEKTFVGFILLSIVSVLSVGLTAFYIGMQKNEQVFVMDLAAKLKNKVLKR